MIIFIDKEKPFENKSYSTEFKTKPLSIKYLDKFCLNELWKVHFYFYDLDLGRIIILIIISKKVTSANIS